MNRDSAIVIFCTTICVAALFWKLAPLKTPIVTPKDDESKPLNVVSDGPGVIRPAQYAAMPYRFLPPVIPYVENRESMKNGC